MVAIIDHRYLQELRKLPFCYSCAQIFATNEVRTRDHVPPSSCFAIEDRIRPVIVPAHDVCNASYKASDELVGQFISLRRGKTPPSARSRRMTFREFRTPNLETHVAIDNVDIRGAVERWVRAMHAALYREPLVPATRFGIETPFAIAVPTHTGGVGLDPGRITQHRLFVEVLKESRGLGNIDRVVANNGKFRYECVWDQATNKNWMCMFALDIYDWKDLGRTSLGPKKGCVGFYQYLLPDPPAKATKRSPLKSTATNLEPLDPFGR
jgi:hypothetical protein